MRLTVPTLLALGAMSLPSAAIVDRVPPERQIAFKVLNDGTEIGHHRVTFETSGETVTVRTDIELSAYLAFVRVFHYRHEAKETWQGGQLVGFQSQTYDDGTDLSVMARLEGGAFKVDGATFDGVLRAGLIPTSYWNKALVEQQVLFNTQTGAELPVTITYVGEEEIAADGRRITADRYRLVSDMTLDLWYDENGHWAKSRFTARGSEIEYIREARGVVEAAAH